MSYIGMGLVELTGAGGWGLITSGGHIFAVSASSMFTTNANWYHVGQTVISKGDACRRDTKGVIVHICKPAAVCEMNERVEHNSDILHVVWALGRGKSDVKMKFKHLEIPDHSAIVDILEATFEYERQVRAIVAAH